MKLDLTGLLAEALGRGAGLERGRLLAHAAHEGERARAELLALGTAGQAGFLRLPGERGLLNDLDQALRGLPFPVRQVAVLGIGGSSLGLQAVAEVCAVPPDRLVFFENLDPDTLPRALAALDWAGTLAIMTSKSGRTIETLAQGYLVEAAAERALGPAWTRHVWYVTDPEVGFLRGRARELGIQAFPIPPDVGGRFSILSAVGLAPVCALGLPAGEMLDGAERAARHFLAAEPGANLPILAASALCLALDAGLPVHVFLPYADRLRKLAEWYVQLWGESLGKGGRGPTPLRGVGAVDQHSLLQLLVDGPRDKLVLFVEPAWDAPEPRIPHFPAAPRGYYPGGHRVAEVLLTEKRATEMALAESGVPSLTLACGALGLGALGELFQVLETVTALAGLMLGVNPFDQPGVELTKKYIHGLLGVPGFEEHRARFDAFRAALEPLEVSIDR